jgi:hypothetical protein
MAQRTRGRLQKDCGDGAITGPALAAVDCSQGSFQAFASLSRDRRMQVALHKLVI